ncbi:hypothetical protein DFH09DRAFT_1100112 [Mycena vulgaris]|nr:hypothetical protein DFH09DRAFT_1100112 [Mycena vulgaris]
MAVPTKSLTGTSHRHLYPCSTESRAKKSPKIPTGTGGNNIEMGGREDATSNSQVQERFLSSDGKPIRVPKIPLAEFCQEYGINENIQRILASEGFETAGAILEISETGLKDTLKIGEIGELRRALREFISKELLDGAQ